MAKRMMDVALDANEDLDVSSGDIMAVESTYQHQRQLILNNKGDFKENPTICVGGDTYKDDEGPDAIMRAIAQAFIADGMQVTDMRPNGNAVADSTARLFVNAAY